MWQQDIGVFPISWAEQAHEWAVHLARLLSGRDELPGQGRPLVGEVILNPPDGSMSCSLRITPDPEGIACMVFCEEGPGSADEVRRWREAAEEAVLRMGQHDQDFTWRAILGPDPGGFDLDRHGPLAEPVAMGPVLLAPGGVQMRELTGNARGNRIDRPWPARYSWPVIASGTVCAYQWQPAETVARKLVHRVCALLSICRNVGWAPRSGPDVQIPGFPERGMAAVPQSVGPWESTGFPDESLPPDFNTYTGEHPLLVVPPWVLTAWALMDRDGAFATAVRGCYEAMILEPEHPSVAFLLYVATIEGIGARSVPLARCEKCNSQLGAGKRFCEALRTVLEPHVVTAIANLAYKVRSKTGHEGLLIGTEQTFGFGNVSLFQFDSAEMFDYTLLWPMRAACRRLIREIVREAEAQEIPDQAGQTA